MASEKELERMVIRFVGDGSSYAAMLKDAEQRTRSTAKKLERLGLKIEAIGSKMVRMGGGMTAKVSAPLTLMAAAAVKSFADFDSAMTKSTSIMSVTQEEIEAMRQKALQLSSDGKIPQGPEQLGEAYYFLASAGLDAKKSIASLQTVAEFATAGAFDMAQATDLLTDAQSALGMVMPEANDNLREMTRLSNVLVKANTMANASVQQFSEALTNGAGASLRAVNKTVEEGTAVLAAYADQGVKGAVAGSNLDRVLRLLKDSALKNSVDHKKLKFSVFDTNGEMRNMADIIENLETVMQGMSAKQKAATLTTLGFRAQVQQAIMPLLGMSSTIRKYEENLKNVDNVTKRVAEKQMESFTNKARVLWNQIKILAMEFGKELIPALEGLIEKLKTVVKWFSSLSPETKQQIVYVGALVAAIGPLLMVFGGITIAIGKLLTTFRFLSVAMKALRVGGIAKLSTAVLGLNPIVLKITALVAAWAAAKWASDKFFGIHHFQEELKKTKKLLGDIQGMQSKKGERRLKEAQGIQDPMERQKALKRLLSQAGNDMRGYNQAIQRTQKEIDKLEDGWRAKSGIGDKRIEELKQLQEEQKSLASDASKRFKDIKKAYDESLLSPEEEAKKANSKEETKEVVAAAEKLEAAEELKKKLVEEVKTAREEAERELAQFGMNENLKKIENLKAQGASEEDLKPLRIAYARLEVKERMKKLEEENKQIEEERAATAKAVKEQYATESQRHQMEVDRLNKLKEEGTIGADLHRQAMESLEKQYNKKYTASFNFDGVEGVEVGSAEALAMMRRQAFEFQNAAKAPQMNPTVTNKLEPQIASKQVVLGSINENSKDTTKIVNPLNRLVEIAEENLTKRTQENLVVSDGIF